MKELFYVVNLPHGLHARPAAQLAQICSAAQSMVTIIKGDKSANGKGVLGILSFVSLLLILCFVGYIYLFL